MGTDRTVAGMTELIALARNGAAELDDVPLSPAPPYQTRPVTIRELEDAVAAALAPGFSATARAGFPQLIVAHGKCRVGSTVLTNLFGIAGIAAHYQPVKTAARWFLIGQYSTGWLLPRAAESPVLFAKEMAGPYLAAEALLNPLRPLIDAGYPPERLHLLLLDREPFACLGSWLARWTGRRDPEALLDNFVLSAVNAARVEGYARQQGVAVTRYVYEASRDPETAIRALFTRLGVGAHYRPGVVSGWGESGALESAASKITFPPEPPAYNIPGLHGTSTGYEYRPARGGVTAAHRERLIAEGVPELYSRAVRGCGADLGLSEAQCERMFGTPQS